MKAPASRNQVEEHCQCKRARAHRLHSGSCIGMRLYCMGAWGYTRFAWGVAFYNIIHVPPSPIHALPKSSHPPHIPAIVHAAPATSSTRNYHHALTQVHRRRPITSRRIMIVKYLFRHAYSDILHMRIHATYASQDFSYTATYCVQTKVAMPRWHCLSNKVLAPVRLTLYFLQNQLPFPYNILYDE